MTQTKIVPWLELGLDQEAIDNAVAGLELWRRVCDRVCISVDPGSIDSLRIIWERVPDLHYIPGLKTSPILKSAGFDSPDGWRKVSQCVSDLCSLTGSKTLLFEHESAIKSYIVDGIYPMDFAKLLDGLAQLPSDITYLWFPSAAMSGETLTRYLRLARVVDATIDAVFIDHASFFAPRFRNTPGTLRCTSALRSIASKPPVPQVLCSGDAYWPLNMVRDAAELADADFILAYPGVARWVEAAKMLNEEMRYV